MNSFSIYDTTILSMGALFLGIIMLIRGGNWAIDSSVYVASRFGISPMVIGFTIIAFGTSLPELVVSLFANIQGSPGIAIGNVLGSNISNILMVAGVSATFITLKVTVTKMLARDLIFMMLATVALTALLYSGTISSMAGGIMLSILLAYIFMQYLTTKNDNVDTDELPDAVFESDKSAYITLFLGMVCIAVGAEFLVKGAKVSAGLIGVPESVIALSIIAFGTSLPELSTSIIASRKGQSDMVIGNIIGSNVFNILMIIGFASLAKPIITSDFSPQIMNFDIWVTLLVGLVFMITLLIFGRINRVIGILFLSSYIVYNVYIYAASMSI